MTRTKKARTTRRPRNPIPEKGNGNSRTCSSHAHTSNTILPSMLVESGGVAADLGGSWSVVSRTTCTVTTNSPRTDAGGVGGASKTSLRWMLTSQGMRHARSGDRYRRWTASTRNRKPSSSRGSDQSPPSLRWKNGDRSTRSFSLKSPKRMSRPLVSFQPTSTTVDTPMVPTQAALVY